MPDKSSVSSFFKSCLMSPSGVVEIPRLQAKQGFRVTWLRATIPSRRAHEERLEGACGLAAEIPESGTDRGRRVVSYD